MSEQYPKEMRHMNGQRVIVYAAPVDGAVPVWWCDPVEDGGCFGVADYASLTLIPDTIPITVELTREQVEEGAMWEGVRAGSSSPWGAIGDACRAFLADEEQRA